jgi:hypothetical protein
VVVVSVDGENMILPFYRKRKAKGKQKEERGKNKMCQHAGRLASTSLRASTASLVFG